MGLEGKAKYKQANILKDKLISDMCHEENWLGEEVGGKYFRWHNEGRLLCGGGDIWAES